MTIENYKNMYLIKTCNRPIKKLTKYEIEISRTVTRITYIKYSNKDYTSIVEDLIRLKYSMSDELAFLRQQSVKIEEYTEYYNYVEECKSVAKKFVEERKNAIGI